MLFILQSNILTDNCKVINNSFSRSILSWSSLNLNWLNYRFPCLIVCLHVLNCKNIRINVQSNKSVGLSYSIKFFFNSLIKATITSLGIISLKLLQNQNQVRNQHYKQFHLIISYKKQGTNFQFIKSQINNCVDMSTFKELDQMSVSYPPKRQKCTTIQRIISVLFLMIFFQGIFFIVNFLMVYSLVTLNFYLMGTLALISVLQYPFKKSETFVNLANKMIKPLLYYRNFKKIYEEPIQQNPKCMFCFHPHSVFSYSILANMNVDGENSIMSSMVGLASRFMLNIPITGLLLRLWGVQSVDQNNLNKLLIQEKPIGLLPGGFEQATLTTPKQLRVFIKHRKGFLKYALKHDYTIYPVLVFNQHKAYWTFDWFLKLRMLLNKIKLPGVFFFGYFGIFTTPSIDNYTIVGKGIKLEKKQDEEKQEGQDNSNHKKIKYHSLQTIHQQYMAELKRLYEKYKHLNGDVPFVMY